MPFCRQCGEEVPENVKFCMRCGQNISGKQHRLKKKNRVVACILGLIIGPLGSFYFGFKIGIVSTFTTILANILIVLISNYLTSFSFMPWMYIVWAIFFGVYNIILATAINTQIEEGSDKSEITAIIGPMMGTWIVRITIWVNGLYTTVLFIVEKDWLWAILTPIVILPLTMWFLDMLMGFLMAIVFGVISAVSDRK